MGNSRVEGQMVRRAWRRIVVAGCAPPESTGDTRRARGPTEGHSACAGMAVVPTRIIEGFDDLATLAIRGLLGGARVWFGRAPGATLHVP